MKSKVLAGILSAAALLSTGAAQSPAQQACINALNKSFATSGDASFKTTTAPSSPHAAP